VLWSRYARIREVLRGAASSGEPALRQMWDASQQQRALTAERGWSQAAYQRWLADTLTAALLPPRAP
jgi:hypothetical protein